MLEHDGWIVSVTEADGDPLILAWDARLPAGYAEPGRRWAVEVKLSLARFNSLGLPFEPDYPLLAELERALVSALAASPDTDRLDWRYVARLYGQAVARFCFYAPRPSRAAERVRSALAGLAAVEVKLTDDSRWEAWNRLCAGVDAEHGRTATPRRTAPRYAAHPAPEAPRGTTPLPRDEQPWRGDDIQTHPED